MRQEEILPWRFFSWRLGVLAFISSLQFPPQLPLDGVDLRFQHVVMSLAVVHLDRAGDAVAVGGERFVTAFNHSHHRVEFALDARSQRPEAVWQAGLVD